MVKGLPVIHEQSITFEDCITGKCQKIKATSYGLGLHVSTEVCMNYLKMFFGSRCGSGETVPLMFPNDTDLTGVVMFMYN